MQFIQIESFGVLISANEVPG